MLLRDSWLKVLLTSPATHSRGKLSPTGSTETVGDGQCSLALAVYEDRQRPGLDSATDLQLSVARSVHGLCYDLSLWKDRCFGHGLPRNVLGTV